MLKSIILYVLKQDNINKKTSGFFGLGMQSYEGSLGISTFENFINNNVIDDYQFSICLSERNSYLDIGSLNQH